MSYVAIFADERVLSSNFRLRCLLNSISSRDSRQIQMSLWLLIFLLGSFYAILKFSKSMIGDAEFWVDSHTSAFQARSGSATRTTVIHSVNHSLSDYLVLFLPFIDWNHPNSHSHVESVWPGSDYHFLSMINHHIHGDPLCVWVGIDDLRSRDGSDVSGTRHQITVNSPFKLRQLFQGWHTSPKSTSEGSDDQSCFDMDVSHQCYLVSSRR